MCVRRPLALFGLVSLPSSRGKACSPAVYQPAQQAALAASHDSASAAAAAFMAACKGQSWNTFDVRKYFYSNWHAGAPAGSSCSSLMRFGNYDDGGKMICRPRRALAQPCNVVSIGSDGDPSFENAVHAYAPHCRIETHDGTLTGKRAKLRGQLPSYIHFVPENMHAETWRRWRNATARSGNTAAFFINVAKVDCEGCEADTVPNMVENVCVNYLLLEMHSCGGTPSNFTVKPRRSKAKAAMAMHSSGGADRSAYGMVRRAHDMLVRLDRLYKIYHVEPNTVYSDGTCIEFAFERRELCGMDTAR